MNYIDQIFARANIQQIRQFLMYGAECHMIEEKTYKDRIDESYKKSKAILKSEIDDEDKQNKIIEGMNIYHGEAERVYMEVGMKCGAMLTMQILKELT